MREAEEPKMGRGMDRDFYRNDSKPDYDNVNEVNRLANRVQQQGGGGHTAEPPERCVMAPFQPSRFRSEKGEARIMSDGVVRRAHSPPHLSLSRFDPRHFSWASRRLRRNVSQRRSRLGPKSVHLASLKLNNWATTARCGSPARHPPNRCHSLHMELTGGRWLPCSRTTDGSRL
ncbi:hypothetical protein BDP81DRAFT_439265 [Colletotrichum phormii]|uniref:Uncharacterized protein n=1 Tax=Colletotrichum phormii TaxID=359342 RepID=A0AAI9ZG88_9PEZI|nr:uncharacterized protein BDP81DRAFT_439265 [Colletotrichum phormii]KAK1623653.1 hypothetical protein BDP81DRAFT_439265 [Colletotrichum phormii]